MMILGYLIVSIILTHGVLGFCSHSNGDSCNGEVACCVDEHTIARCPIPAYEDSGRWEVRQCGGLINLCVDGDSTAGADCI